MKYRQEFVQSMNIADFLNNLPGELVKLDYIDHCRVLGYRSHYLVIYKQTELAKELYT